LPAGNLLYYNKFLFFYIKFFPFPFFFFTAVRLKLLEKKKAELPVFFFSTCLPDVSCLQALLPFYVLFYPETLECLFYRRQAKTFRKKKAKLEDTRKACAKKKGSKLRRIS
jgi:hypothetical protein